MVMLASFSRLLPSLTTLSAEYASFSAHLPVFQSLNEMMSTMSSSKESHGDKSYKRGSLIKFQNVSFSYNEKEIYITKMKVNIVIIINIIGWYLLYVLDPVRVINIKTRECEIY